jgi:hypothetical protein
VFLAFPAIHRIQVIHPVPDLLSAQLALLALKVRLVPSALVRQVNRSALSVQAIR